MRVQNRTVRPSPPNIGGCASPATTRPPMRSDGEDRSAHCRGSARLTPIAGEQPSPGRGGKAIRWQAARYFDQRTVQPRQVLECPCARVSEAAAIEIDHADCAATAHED